VKSWRRVDAKRMFGCPVFDLDRVRFRPPAGGAPRPFYVIDSPSWINVIPLTDDDQVLLIKQYRFGIEDFTLEIPGGMCDPGESPLEAAGRELVEETGYRSDDLVEIGWVHPNPAIQSNRCHTFVARKLTRVGEPSPDPDEEFELVQEPLERIPELIAGRRLTHALVLAAFELFGTRRS
jgi:8-oxo-dGTP pyrophosphatase MutT (NUDIX family)